MAGLNETDEWADEVYQIEMSDPVVGGTPNEGTGAGMSNIPHLQLAKRTKWLKTKVDTLIGQVVDASSAVAGIVKLSTATNSSSTTTAATPSAVKAANDNAETRALKVTTISVTGLATGGGNLDGNRSIGVPPASQAQAEAGADETTAMTPIRVKQAIAALIGGVASGAGFSVYFGANGYIKFPSWLGGLIIQWGKGTLPASGVSASSSNVTFPIVFPAATLAVVGNAQGALNNPSGGMPSFVTTSVTVHGFSATGDALGWANFNQTVPFNWFAIGY